MSCGARRRRRELKTTRQEDVRRLQVYAESANVPQSQIFGDLSPEEKAARAQAIANAAAAGNADDLEITAVERPELPNITPVLITSIAFVAVLLFSFVVKTFVDPTIDANRRLLKIICVPLLALIILFTAQYATLSYAQTQIASDDASQPVVLVCLEGKVQVDGKCAARLTWDQVQQLACSATCTGGAWSRLAGAGVRGLAVALAFSTASLVLPWTAV